MPNDLELDAYFDICTEFANKHLEDAESEDDKAKFVYAMFSIATQARLKVPADKRQSKAERKASVSAAEKLMLEIVRGTANTARRYIDEENS